MFKDERFKELTWVFALAAVALVSFLALSQMWSLMGQWGLVTTGETEGQTATLSAQGTAFAAPDTARFTVSVVSRGATPEVVQEDNSERVEEVISFLKEQGVADADIKTVAYSLQPQYRFTETEGQVLTGYELRQSVQVRTTALADVGVLVSGAVNNGANEVSGVELFIDDPEAVREEARREAVAKLEEKRKSMEQTLGVRFGRVVGVSESDGGGGIPIPFAAEAGFGRGGAGDVAVQSVPSIEPGSQEVMVTVTVTYQLR